MMQNRSEDSNKVIVQYVNHACFLIVYKNTSLLIDPFFSGEFYWQDHLEIQLSKPKIRLKDLPKIDWILCTHIHGDHFDRHSIFRIIRRDDSLLIAPFDVIEACVKDGLNKSRCIIAEATKSVQVKNITIICLPEKGSENQEKCQRFSFVIECGTRKIFHSGDSHGYSKMWDNYRQKINLACLWCVKTEEIIENLQPKAVILHHFEKFSPGDFSCNVDVSQMIEALKKNFRAVRFYNPLEENTVIL